MENKKKFIDRLGEILKLYSREDVEELRYIELNINEYAEITYINSDKKYIDITGDSGIAIMHDIYRAMR